MTISPSLKMVHPIKKRKEVEEKLVTQEEILLEAAYIGLPCFSFYLTMLRLKISYLIYMIRSAKKIFDLYEHIYKINRELVISPTET